MAIVNERFGALMKRMEDALTKLEEARPPCKRVSMCCDAPEAPTNSWIMQALLCSACLLLAEFDCAACHDPWPDREDECLGRRENL